MLTTDVQSYLAVRRTMGFALHSEGTILQSFAAFSEGEGKTHVCAETAIEWAGLARSTTTRARRLGQVIRFARYIRAEDNHHETPPAVFGCEKGPRPTPYIFQVTTSGVSFKPHPSWVGAMLFVAVPTARSLPFCRVPVCGCRKRFIADSCQSFFTGGRP